MQSESTALCELVERELLGRPFSLAMDCHSGFGLRDRIWFPFAHRRSPIRHLAQLHALHEIFQQSNSHHPYVFEPQSRQYLAHGDLWDYLYLRACERPGTVFLPLTLEMGSWLWVQEESAPAVLARWDLQSADRPSPAAGASATFPVARLRHAGGRRGQPLAARGCRMRETPPASDGTVVRMTTWILLRGLTREAGHWGDFAQGLADRLAAHR